MPETGGASWTARNRVVKMSKGGGGGSKWERTKRRGEKVRSVSMAELQKTTPKLADKSGPRGENWSQDRETIFRATFGENKIGRKAKKILILTI